MTDRFEQDIADWYRNSRTVNLEYLNLEEPQKVKLSVLNNNISCIYDKLLLQAKVCILRFHQILENQKELQLRLETCEEFIRKTQSETRKSLQQISSEIHHSPPLTKHQVLDLVQEIAIQPKLVEKEALKLTEDLNLKIQKVEHLLHEVKALLTS